MKAYSQGIEKDQFVEEMKLHAKLDHFVKGTYGRGRGKTFRACSVGCALKSVQKVGKIKNIKKDDHSAFETHLGVPEWLAVLNDKIFEGVSDKRFKKWPVEFAEAINIGSDLDKIKTPFIIFILKNNLDTLDNLKVDPKHKELIEAIVLSRKATEQMIHAHENRLDLSAAESAASAAYERCADKLLEMIIECK